MGAYLVKPSTGVPIREFTRTVYVWATVFGFCGVLVSGLGRSLKLTGRQIGANALLGVLFAASVILAFDAVTVMDPTSASVLMRTSVLFVVVLGFLVLGETLSASEAMGAGLVILGVMGLVRVEGTAVARGPLEALGSAACAALYQLTAKRTLRDVPAGVVNAYRNLSVLVCFLLFELAIGHQPAVARNGQYLTIVACAFVGPFLHTLLNLMALSRMEMVKAVLIAQTQPIFVLLISWLFVATSGLLDSGAGIVGKNLDMRSQSFKLVPRPRELLANGIVLGGVVILVAAGARKRKKTGT